MFDIEVLSVGTLLSTCVLHRMSSRRMYRPFLDVKRGNMTPRPTVSSEVPSYGNTEQFHLQFRQPHADTVAARYPSVNFWREKKSKSGHHLGGDPDPDSMLVRLKLGEERKKNQEENALCAIACPDMTLRAN
nr:hypothetical protein CFP56_57624 [Quercus suber]